MTEQEIIKDIKENRIGKYSDEHLNALIRNAKYICDNVKFDTPLSTDITTFGISKENLAFDSSWRRAKNLQESIDIALNKRDRWTNPNNDKLYTVLFSMRQALHNSLAWLTTDSKYKEAYKWLDEKEAFYQQTLKERNDRVLDPFKKAQWEIELKKREEAGIPFFEQQTCKWIYLNYKVGEDGHYYRITKDGEVKKDELTLADVLARSAKLK